MTPTEVRLRLFHAGYRPLPLYGKSPEVNGKGWQQKRLTTNDDDICMWAKQWPDAANTGVLCRDTPFLDIDIRDPEAAEAAELLVKDRFDGHCVLTRIGQWPKRAIPFQTAAPFPKMMINLIDPGGGMHKLEFLGDGQQVVVDGIHPDAREPYMWHGGILGEIRRDDLPGITADEARQLLDDIAEFLVAEHGYRIAGASKKPGADGGYAGGEWPTVDELIDHDKLVSMAMSLARAGTHPGAIYNMLETLVRSLTGVPADRQQRRLEELRSIVDSGVRKTERVRDPPQAGPPAWHWHGEADPVDTRKYLVAGLLPETGAALISGQWGTYKTFVGDDLAASIMTGKEFINFPVLRKGGVAWLACEGRNEVDIRLTAAWTAKGGTGNAPFAWIANCPPLLDPKAGAALVTMIKPVADQMQQQFGLPLAAVFIDTVGIAAGLTKDGQLNDDAVAKVIMKALSDASADTGALFIGIAHFGKTKEVGTKGSSGFEDNADVVLAMLGEKGINGIVEAPRLCIRKRRFGANGEEFGFRTHSVELSRSDNPETTLTIQWTGQAESRAAKPDKDPWAAKSLRLLRQTLMNMLADCGKDIQPFPDGPMVRAVAQEAVRAEFYKSYPAVGDAKAKQAAKQKAFRRALLDAQAEKLIGIRDIETDTWIWLASTPGRTEGTGQTGHAF
jgi:hypothetical protein